MSGLDIGDVLIVGGEKLYLLFDSMLSTAVTSMGDPGVYSLPELLGELVMFRTSLETCKTSFNSLVYSEKVGRVALEREAMATSGGLGVVDAGVIGEEGMAEEVVIVEDLGRETWVLQEVVAISGERCKRVGCASVVS